ncbi:class I SAM-dependent methyltransferase [Nitrospina gracilis]|uniref:class I SAM-dependent methyltransferase n=1 Tax=Nitrospina gracilis TaxID=35801 RepID=UPI001F200379|nr:class I SAM-dependent methyltransferase [Nitrospina gracilis]MCF8721788.1 SAM-dependent methyltransferase [Nitrospina gracilis Nb-211]
MPTQNATIDENRLHEFMGKMVGDLGAAATSVLVILGQELGLYRAIAEHGPLTADELAQKTGAAPRYLQEWAANQAASGYIEYDADTHRFSQTPEQAAVFADEESPFFMGGGFYSIASLFSDQPKLVELFRTGKGLSWGDHDSCLFCGTAKFFKPTYKANLLASWIPALDGVQAKLEKGAKVADVGCGYGHSTLMMAEAFPNSRFYGYDFHAPSIEHATQLAKEKGLGNVTFEVAKAKSFPGEGYDLITFFDCLHDMGDPQGACRSVHGKLDPDGTLMIVEPIAKDTLKENLNPVGRVYYAFSTTVCTPSSLSQEVGLALGAQAGEKRLREVVTAGGFTRFRRASETPFNMVLEARP